MNRNRAAQTTATRWTGSTSQMMEKKKKAKELPRGPKEEEEVVHTRSPIIPTSEADFIAWNRRTERLRRQAIKLHVSNLMIYRICKNCNCIETF
jgi:hypothetical protein